MCVALCVWGGGGGYLCRERAENASFPVQAETCDTCDWVSLAQAVVER